MNLDLFSKPDNFIEAIKDLFKEKLKFRINFLANEPTTD